MAADRSKEMVFSKAQWKGGWRGDDPLTLGLSVFWVAYAKEREPGGANLEDSTVALALPSRLPNPCAARDWVRLEKKNGAGNVEPRSVKGNPRTTSNLCSLGLSLGLVLV